MKISDKAFVAIDYALSLDSGEEVDRSKPGSPLCFIFNTGQMMIGLEKMVEGKEVGWKGKFTVEVEDGYGHPRKELFKDVTRDMFPPDTDLQPGLAFQASFSRGVVPFIVKAVDGDDVTIDFNHPLCGQRLHFDVTVVEVREATAEELADAAGSCECSEQSCEHCD
jgi:FKBP-type peptidyl-prolyl cis-trans isomerase SlyD